MAKQNWPWFDHRTDVPQWVASGIGRVCIEWALVERELEELLNLLLDVDIQVSRIAVNQMNARTRHRTATNLLQAHVLNKTLPSTTLKAFVTLAADIEAVQNKRDILAHGLWAKRNGEWWVLKLRQSRKTPQYAPDLASLSRAVLPQREQMTKTKVRAIAKEVVGIAKAVQTYRENLEGALSPSRYTRLQYSRKRYDYH